MRIRNAVGATAVLAMALGGCGFGPGGESASARDKPAEEMTAAELVEKVNANMAFTGFHNLNTVSKDQGGSVEWFWDPARGLELLVKGGGQDLRMTCSDSAMYTSVPMYAEDMRGTTDKQWEVLARYKDFFVESAMPGGINGCERLVHVPESLERVKGPARKVRGTPTLALKGSQEGGDVVYRFVAPGEPGQYRILERTFTKDGRTEKTTYDRFGEGHEIVPPPKDKVISAQRLTSLLE